MSSLFKVPYTEVLNVSPHPNADRLEILTIYGFHVVAQKGQYKTGDRVVYIPVDSVLPQSIEDILFPPDAKIRPNKHRIRQIRIRSFPSQGMVGLNV